MKTKDAIKEIINNISDSYLRFDFSFIINNTTNGWFLIPTIEFIKSKKFLEINILILCSCFNICINKGNLYEDES